ncbi:golgin subfamily A member 6-like protein 7 [Euwallacea fornicatus]|uniref:golgin subfamily A member 6-like protein 7 n=1 Tax=Euwallacea fornicatus TaxID=995702 RepID=UPI00338F0EA8
MDLLTKAEEAMRCEEIKKNPEALLLLNKHLFDANKALIKRVEQLERMLQDQSEMLKSIKESVQGNENVRRKKKRTQKEEESEGDEDEDMEKELDSRQIQQEQAREKQRQINKVSDSRVDKTSSSTGKQSDTETKPSRLADTTPAQVDATLMKPAQVDWPAPPKSKQKSRQS